jgi:hypothetical protein
MVHARLHDDGRQEPLNRAYAAHMSGLEGRAYVPLWAGQEVYLMSPVHVPTPMSGPSVG